MSEAPTIDKRAIGLLADAIAAELWAWLIEDSWRGGTAPDSILQSSSNNTLGNRLATAPGIKAAR